MIVSGVRDNEPDDLQVYPYTSIYEGTEWTSVIAFKFALVDATGRPSREPRSPLVFLSFLIILGASPSRSSSRFLFLFSGCPAVPSAQHCFSPPSSFLSSIVPVPRTNDFLAFVFPYWPTGHRCGPFTTDTYNLPSSFSSLFLSLSLSLS